MKITITKCLLECREGRLASAVARCHEGHFEGIAQSRDDLLDFLVVGYHQMETAGDEVESWVDRGRGCDDLVDARMRAAYNDHYAVGRVDRERQLSQRQRTRFVRDHA